MLPLQLLLDSMLHFRAAGLLILELVEVHLLSLLPARQVSLRKSLCLDEDVDSWKISLVSVPRCSIRHACFLRLDCLRGWSLQLKSLLMLPKLRLHLHFDGLVYRVLQWVPC